MLASASPRRAELLRAAGFSFETLAVDVDEAARPGEPPADYVRRLAVVKAERAFEMLVGPPKGGPHVPSRTADSALDVGSGFGRTGSDGEIVVLGADTTVVIDGEILGKPADASEAERMLRRLAGRRHEVLTGVCLRRTEGARVSVETTGVDVMPIRDADVRWYVASGEGLDKAGAYAIQGLASRFITRIEGSYSNVVGLPVHTVAALLREMP